MATSITFTGSPEAIAFFIKSLNRWRDGGPEFVQGENYRLSIFDGSDDRYDHIGTCIGVAEDNKCYDYLAAMSTKTLIGAEVIKKFNKVAYKGIVMAYNKKTKYYMVEYEDGDSEEMDRDEIYENMNYHAPISFIEAITWIEESGNKAQSFAKVLRTIVENKPGALKAIPGVFKRIVNANVSPCVHPGLWKELGETEMEKLFYAKRILEAIIFTF